MDDLNGKRKVIRSSPILSTGQTGNPYSWQQSAALLSNEDEAQGFLIVTSTAGKDLVDIHDRLPLVLSPETAREWMRQDVSGREAEDIISDDAVPADKFIWHGVPRTVGNPRNQGPELIDADF